MFMATLGHNVKRIDPAFRYGRHRFERTFGVMPVPRPYLLIRHIGQAQQYAMSKWDARMLEMCTLVAGWSKDPSTGVGAVIVDRNNRVVSLGFNGFPRAVRDDDGVLADRERKLKRTIHAEENALLFAQRSFEGFTIYVSIQPCAKCTAKIIQSGIARIICGRADEQFAARWVDEFEEAASMMAEARIKFEVRG